MVSWGFLVIYFSVCPCMDSSDCIFYSLLSSFSALRRMDHTPNFLSLFSQLFVARHQSAEAASRNVTSKSRIKLIKIYSFSYENTPITLRFQAKTIRSKLIK
jgi:hypothetical protein